MNTREYGEILILHTTLFTLYSKNRKKRKEEKKMLVNRENGTVQGVGDPRSFMEAIVGEIN